MIYMGESFPLTFIFFKMFKTTNQQYTGDYNNPIEESLLTNQYNGMIEGFGTLLNC